MEMQEQNQIEIQATPRLIAIDELIKKSFSFYTEHFSVIAQIMLVPTIVALLLPVVTQFSNVLVGIIFVIHMVASIFASTVILMFLINKGLSEGGILETYKKASVFILPIIWVSILSFVVVGGGLLLFIVPGIIIMVHLVFNNFIIVAEGKRGLAVFAQGWFYVRTRGMEVFLRYLVLFLISLIVSSALNTLSGFFFETQDPVNLKPFTETLPFIFGAEFVVGSLVQNFVLIPFASIYLFMLYMSLKAVKGTAEQTTEEAHRIKRNLLLIGLLPILVLALIITAVGVYNVGSISIESLKGGASLLKLIN